MFTQQKPPQVLGLSTVKATSYAVRTSQRFSKDIQESHVRNIQPPTIVHRILSSKETNSAFHQQNLLEHCSRTAFRRLALLVHPDKNPGEEEKCHQALLRAQHAREAALALLSAPAPSAGAAPGGAPAPGPPAPARRPGPAPRPKDEAQLAREPQPRKDFASKEAAKSRKKRTADCFFLFFFLLYYFFCLVKQKFGHSRDRYMIIRNEANTGVS